MASTRQVWQLEEVRVNIWDFGGQDIQLSAHRLFLTERSLYVLVLDRRREEEPEHWLEHIRSLGGNSPVLVVWNKIDEHPTQTQSEKYLRDHYPNIVGFFPLSCRSGQGFDEFVPRLKNEIGKLELVNQPCPGTWHRVKARLEQETSAGQLWLSYGTFQQICAAAGVTDGSAQRTLVQYLNDLGTVCFFDDPELAHLQILNPQWLLSGIYKLLISPMTQQRFGDIEIGDFPDILTAVEPDDFVYQCEHYPYLIALMKKFELCYAQDKRLLIPAAFTPETKGEYADFRQQDSTHYFIQYQHRPPTSIIHRLIVRLLPQAEDNDYWSTGIQLHDDTLQARALVQFNRQERCIDIGIIAKDPLPYWLQLRDHIREINRFFAHIEWRERMMVGQRAEEYLDFDELLVAKNERVSEYFAPALRQKIPVDASLARLATEKEIENRTKAGVLDQMLRGNFPVPAININTSSAATAKATNEMTITVELSTQLDDLTGAINRALRTETEEITASHTALLNEALEDIKAIRENSEKRVVRTGGYLGSFRDLVDDLLKMEKLYTAGVLVE